MTLGEYIGSCGNEGVSCGKSRVIALNLNGAEAAEDYVVITENAFELKCSVVSDMASRRFVFGGKKYIRRGAARKLSLMMDRVTGDAGQELLLSQDIIFGSDGCCTADYVYIDTACGYGERGRCVIDIISDFDGGDVTEAVIYADIYGYDIEEYHI